MKKIICFSASNGEAYKNFNNTVATPSKLDEKIRSEIKSGETLHSIWAMRHSRKNLGLWSKINSGDIALFYGHKKFIGYGEIIGTLNSEEISKKYFNKHIYTLIIVLKPVKLEEKKRDRMWELFKYSEQARVQGMMIPNIQIQNDLLKDYKDVDHLVEYIMS